MISVDRELLGPFHISISGSKNKKTMKNKEKEARGGGGESLSGFTAPVRSSTTRPIQLWKRMEKLEEETVETEVGRLEGYPCQASIY